ncbi:MAG: cysteine desulfurase [Clostridia bacterium]|nr:cysteine desulfurase [Clostridia bacterium]
MFVYADNASTTQPDERVYDAMKPYFMDVYGNSSSLHAMGRNALAAADRARGLIAQSINASDSEIYFTSGGTESDNWAITGVAKALEGKGRHIITTSIEHPAVLNSCKELERQGWEITYLPVDSVGLIDLTQLERSIRDDTVLISVMWANNEIGSVMPINEIGRIARGRGVYFHTDAVQAAGSIAIDVKHNNIDLLSISGHKLYGPKGVGVLYKRNGVKCSSFMKGGEQERGQRAGTLNIPAIVGMGEALKYACYNMSDDNAKIKSVRDYFIRRVRADISDVKYNGPTEDNLRLCGNANFTFNNVNGDVLLARLDMEGICASSGAACSSGTSEPSHVLLAIGASEDAARSTLRFSWGKYNSMEEVDYTVDRLKAIIAELRESTTLFKTIKGEDKYV